VIAVLARTALLAALTLPAFLPHVALAAPEGRTARMCATATTGQRTCYGIWRTHVPQPATEADTPAGYTPAQIAAAYALPMTGSTATIALVDAYDDPKAESDLAVYRARFGLPACTTANSCFRKLNQYGASTPLPRPDRGWAGEISLDLDVASAACPTCRLLLVEADGTGADDLGMAVVAAAKAGATVISNSYGGPEDGHEAEYDARYYHQPGVAVVASTGDDGYGVSYPATSPYVTAVGGTRLLPAATARGWAESAWSGTGAGCSADEARPAFQANLNTGCAGRAVADVSAVADPETGVAAYDSYQEEGWQVVGGTSVSAPIIAGAYGLGAAVMPAPVTAAAVTLDPRVGSPNALPYAHPGALFDVTTGSDGPCPRPELCTARPGYDLPTGLGTPNGIAAFTVVAPASR
jgi:hypothetical protein